MHAFVAFSFIGLFVIQGYGLEDPSPSKIEVYKNLIADWAETAKRIARSMEVRPQEDAEGVSAQLRAAMEEGRRHRRAIAETAQNNDQLQNILLNFNEGLKNIMGNVTSSPLYKEMQKIGENLNAKGKELVGQLQDQVKNFQAKNQK